MSAGGRTTWTDTLTRLATGLTVAGLSGVAGAISFSHMSTLAAEHGQLGWKATAFPISVDGLELVASLYILAQHRALRRPGLLPWLALAVGTAVSLAANIAVGGHDTVGRALAGWPAVSLLVSIKLLFSMFDHTQDDRHTVRDDRRTHADDPSVPETDRQSVPTDGPPGTAVQFPDEPHYVQGDPIGVPIAARRTNPGTSGPAPLSIDAVSALLPAARAAHAALAASGHSLSRDGLANQMRRNGHSVSNARMSLLLKAIRTEPDIAGADQAA